MDCSGYSTNRAQQEDAGSASWASSSSTTSFEGAAAFEQSAELQAASTSQTAEPQVAPQPAGADAALRALEGRVNRAEVANILDGLVAEMTAAGFKWMGYAALLGQGYAAGWQSFQRTTAEQAEVDAIPGQIACLVLDVLTAGVLGGVVGGLGRAGRISAGTVDTLGPALGKVLGLTLAVTPAKAPPAPADPLTMALGFSESINRDTARQLGALASWRVAVTASDAPLEAHHVAQARAAVDAWRKTCPLLKDLPKESAQTLADDFERGLWGHWVPGLLETKVDVLVNPLALPGERGFTGVVGAHFAPPGEVVAARLRALGAPLRTPWDATAHTLLLSWANYHSKEVMS